MLNPKCLLNCTPGKKRRDDRVEEERPEPQVQPQLESELRVDGGHNPGPGPESRRRARKWTDANEQQRKVRAVHGDGRQPRRLLGQQTDLGVQDQSHGGPAIPPGHAGGQ